jgi:hypothetical protein
MATVISNRDYRSYHHLWAAEHFAFRTRKIEDGYIDKRKNFDIEHRAYVSNSILSAVGFLEASINEVFVDVVDGDSNVGSLTAECRRLMADSWDERKQRLKGVTRDHRPVILVKYQVALRSANAAALDERDQPYVDADLLIILRNKLTHAHPKTRTTGDLEELGKALLGKFAPNSLTTNQYFPDLYLGAGCADWAVKAARTFADEFFSRLKIAPNYQMANFPPIDCGSGSNASTSARAVGERNARNGTCNEKC